MGVPNWKALEILPKANPVCTHHWESDDLRMVYICAECGYTLTAVDLMIEHEGDVLPGLSVEGWEA